MLSPEVDAVITVRGKAVCCAEVNMKARKKDLEVLRSKTSGLDCEKIVVDADNVVSLFGWLLGCWLLIILRMNYLVIL